MNRAGSTARPGIRVRTLFRVAAQVGADLWRQAPEQLGHGDAEGGDGTGGSHGEGDALARHPEGCAGRHLK